MKYLPLIEVTCNNNYQATIQMAPYEALYGRKCRSLPYKHEVRGRKIMGSELVVFTSVAIERTQNCNKTARSRQKSYADVRCRPLEFEVGYHMF